MGWLSTERGRVFLLCSTSLKTPSFRRPLNSYNKGIVCKVNLKDYCLNILVESESLPNQEECIQFLKKGLLSLKPNGIERVKVFGKKTGESRPDWNTSFEIIESINPFANPNSQLAIVILYDL